jgi:hypothetical protein
MIERIARSGPGEPDLTVPRMIGYFGWAFSLLGLLAGLVFAVLHIRGLPRHRRHTVSAITPAPGAEQLSRCAANKDIAYYAF